MTDFCTENDTSDLTEIAYVRNTHHLCRNKSSLFED